MNERGRFRVDIAGKDNAPEDSGLDIGEEGGALPLIDSVQASELGHLEDGLGGRADLTMLEFGSFEGFLFAFESCLAVLEHAITSRPSISAVEEGNVTKHLTTARTRLTGGDCSLLQTCKTT